MTAYDDRGDLKQVNLYADGALVGTVPVFPFQFRYTPPTSKVGLTVKLTAEAIDKAGNKSTRDLHGQHRRHRRSRALAGAGQQADALRHAGGRPDDVLPQRRVPQQPALVRVRVAAHRLPDHRRHGVELHADRRPISAGRSPARCRRPTRRHRRRDVRGLYVSTPGRRGPVDGPRSEGRNGATAPRCHRHAAPVATTKPAGARQFTATCKLSANGKSITCTVGARSQRPTTTKFTGTVRLAGPVQDRRKRHGQGHADAAVEQARSRRARRWS